MEQKNLLIEIFTIHPAAFEHCVDCEMVWHEIESDESPHLLHMTDHVPPSQAQEYRQIAFWVADMIRHYGDQILVRVVDALSFHGVVKASQHEMNHFPAVVLNRGNWFTADDLPQASAEAVQILGKEPLRQ